MRKIPDNITCLTWDDVLEAGQDENQLNCFRCENCFTIFATETGIRFPTTCPNCGEHFTWKEKS